MYILTKDEQKIMVTNAQKPKLRSKRGKTWDSKVVKIEEQFVYLNYDSTWGRRFYFHYQDKWYCGDVWDLDLIQNRTEVKVCRGK